MSNGLIGDRPTSSRDPPRRRTPRRSRAWLQLLGCVLGLALLAAGLPGPAILLGVLSAAAPTRAPAMRCRRQRAQAAILADRRPPGLGAADLERRGLRRGRGGQAARRAGSIGRSLLRRIAPAAAGRLVAAAVGVSLLAGTSACAVPAMADLGSGSSTEAVGSQVARHSVRPRRGRVGGGRSRGIRGIDHRIRLTGAAGTPAPIPAVPSTDAVIASIVIDWPDAAGPTVSRAVHCETPQQNPAGSTPSSPASAPASATANHGREPPPTPIRPPPTPTTTTEPSRRGAGRRPPAKRHSAVAGTRPQRTHRNHRSRTTTYGDHTARTDDDHRGIRRSSAAAIRSGPSRPTICRPIPPTRTSIPPGALGTSPTNTSSATTPT